MTNIESDELLKNILGHPPSEHNNEEQKLTDNTQQNCEQTARTNEAEQEKSEKTKQGELLADEQKVLPEQQLHSTPDGASNLLQDEHHSSASELTNEKTELQQSEQSHIEEQQAAPPQIVINEAGLARLAATTQHRKRRAKKQISLFEAEDTPNQQTREEPKPHDHQEREELRQTEQENKQDEPDRKTEEHLPDRNTEQKAEVPQKEETTTELAHHGEEPTALERLQEKEQESGLDRRQDEIIKSQREQMRRMEVDQRRMEEQMAEIQQQLEHEKEEKKRAQEAKQDKDDSTLNALLGFVKMRKGGLRAIPSGRKVLPETAKARATVQPSPAPPSQTQSPPAEQKQQQSEPSPKQTPEAQHHESVLPFVASSPSPTAQAAKGERKRATPVSKRELEKEAIKKGMPTGFALIYSTFISAHDEFNAAYSSLSHDAEKLKAALNKTRALITKLQTERADTEKLLRSAEQREEYGLAEKLNATETTLRERIKASEVDLQILLTKRTENEKKKRALVEQTLKQHGEQIAKMSEFEEAQVKMLSDFEASAKAQEETWKEQSKNTINELRELQEQLRAKLEETDAEEAKLGDEVTAASKQQVESKNELVAKHEALQNEIDGLLEKVSALKAEQEQCSELMKGYDEAIAEIRQPFEEKFAAIRDKKSALREQLSRAEAKQQYIENNEDPSVQSAFARRDEQRRKVECVAEYKGKSVEIVKALDSRHKNEVVRLELEEGYLTRAAEMKRQIAELQQQGEAAEKSVRVTASKLSAVRESTLGLQQAIASSEALLPTLEASKKAAAAARNYKEAQKHASELKARKEKLTVDTAALEKLRAEEASLAEELGSSSRLLEAGKKNYEELCQLADRLSLEFRIKITRSFQEEIDKAAQNEDYERANALEEEQQVYKTELDSLMKRRPELYDEVMKQFQSQEAGSCCGTHAGTSEEGHGQESEKTVEDAGERDKQNALQEGESTQHGDDNPDSNGNNDDDNKNTRETETTTEEQQHQTKEQSRLFLFIFFFLSFLLLLLLFCIIIIISFILFFNTLFFFFTNQFLIL